VNVSVFYANPIAAISGFVLFALGMPLYYFIQWALGRKTSETRPNNVDSGRA
jgi:hypothetical protein